MYRTVTDEYPKDKPFDFDMIVLFTPAGVKSLLENFPDFKQGNTCMASFWQRHQRGNRNRWLTL